MAVDVRRIGHDPGALEAFYGEHIERIQRFIARRVDDPYLAADLTAEVFLAAMSSTGRYRASLGTPTGWLYGVAHNLVAAERRRSAREFQAQGRIAGRRLIASGTRPARRRVTMANTAPRTPTRPKATICHGVHGPWPKKKFETSAAVAPTTKAGAPPSA